MSMRIYNRQVVVFNANTPQVAAAKLFINSLRDKKRGNYKGDIWVISTALSAKCKRILESEDVKYFTSPMSYLDSWEAYESIAENYPFYQILKKDSKYSALSDNDKRRLSFNTFRNRCLSKELCKNNITHFRHYHRPFCGLIM